MPCKKSKFVIFRPIQRKIDYPIFLLQHANLDDTKA